jgi:hypothetical protein
MDKMVALAAVALLGTLVLVVSLVLGRLVKETMVAMVAAAAKVVAAAAAVQAVVVQAPLVRMRQAMVVLVQQVQ